MAFTLLLALSGLTLSSVAIYYSVIGLTAIFAAAYWPIVVMGTTLEVSKLVAASWLKAHWTRIPLLMKLYMSSAVVILMIITSMGIFGFLSKAHGDQSLVSGDVQAKIAVYDEKIKTSKDNIDANRKALKQMDEAVDQVMVRSTSETGADKAVGLRRGQAKERARLQFEITSEQKTIASLNEVRAPIAAEVRKVEAEVGPIKYIAALIYGDNPDANLLEKAVTWVIMIIVAVFDPLAVLMLLASQMTWAWYRKEKAEGDSPVETLVVDQDPLTVTEQPANDAKYEQDDGALTADQIEQIKETLLQPEELPKVEEELLVEEEEVPSETPSSALGGDITALESHEELETEPPSTSMQERLATGETYIDGAGSEVSLNEGTEFPANPVKNSTFTRTDFDPKRAFIFDGAQWVDFIESDDSKKKSYMTKEPDGTVKIRTIQDTSKTPNKLN